MESEIIEKTRKYLKNGKGLYWFRTPNPDEDENDDIWSDHPVFNNGDIEVTNRVEWYESPNVPSVYQDHKHIFTKNMDLTRPEEKYYFQNVDSNEFRSKMKVGDENFGHLELPSELGKFYIKIRIRTKTPPSGENEAALVEYFAQVFVKHEAPQGITILPRIFARPINRFFVWAFKRYIGEEAIEEDAEHARQQLTQYFQYLRKYHGEEPVQTKTRLEEPPETPEEGKFLR
jgi:hypothetical protein